jgi:hypothetical protein
MIVEHDIILYIFILYTDGPTRQANTLWYKIAFRIELNNILLIN